MRTALLIRAAALLVALLLAAACAGGADDAAPEEAGDPAHGDAAVTIVTGSLEAYDQDIDGSVLTVASAEIDGAPGWIAVHSDVDGAPGPVLGTAMVREGSNNDVTVTLDQPLTSSAAVWPMLHVDDHTLGAYEFGTVPGADAPVTADGQGVTQRIQLTLAP